MPKSADQLPIIYNSPLFVKYLTQQVPVALECVCKMARMEINPYESPRETGYSSSSHRIDWSYWAGVVTCLMLAFGFWGVVFGLVWAFSTKCGKESLPLIARNLDQPKPLS
jgi:hypothetical protein